MTSIVLSALGQGGGGTRGAGLLSGGMPSNGSLALGGLSGLSSAASTLASIGQIKRNGENQQRSYYQTASDEYLNASQAQVAGFTQVAGLRQQLSGMIGQRMAAAGASGVDAGGQGVVQDNAGKIEDRAIDAGQMDLLNADISYRRHIINALSAVRSGNTAGENASDAASAAAVSGGIGAALNIAKFLL